ncbi:hypothetical protein EMIHUDRAFT_219373 [Emiliania huxleyi CCMP1516]|uniref:Glycosyl hydrolase family 32 N-terminal domain-containing protein n=2 Tax=Emiliania huxleyi TaxID=2903 RepID=A0A0D3I491_EMIH1|nr:hypothetical protein EMIHUDRAFT_219373 [Emiliania huxleyi CCMP1516]EOD06076.1 hypothetical protein EMIHUDRAFT_219373 [Emiliania huxleyi CCMP1516]|eukprot:XP_005758505.1 hypothetical protein EMIHUDRAFT_219373 [Emiliania huxleyi CCMP1516]
MMDSLAWVDGIANPITRVADQAWSDSQICGGKPFCAKPFVNAPTYHLMDQHGCAENDPNGPVFDPVHGVFHHFYQIHLAAPPGHDNRHAAHGPDYGHFVSKDFVSWAAMPVAIWNGLDASAWPPRATPYDNQAHLDGLRRRRRTGRLLTGEGPGIVQIYPGLCNKADWPACETGTLLAQAAAALYLPTAVPADYASDPLLANWTKPSYNPIMENTQRDPSTPQTPSGEWRLRTFNSMVYGSASSKDLLAGKWYEIGKSDDFRQCECPSVYPLPAATPGSGAAHEGTEAAYEEARRAGMPDTELFAQKRIDQGNFYASKDNERINWGWATVPPASAQTLPREVTFNAEARALQQYPIEEIAGLRAAAAFDRRPLAAGRGVAVRGSVGLGIGCSVNYTAGAANASVACGGAHASLSLRAHTRPLDYWRMANSRHWTFVEAYFQRGRVAITAKAAFSPDTVASLTSNVTVAADVSLFPMKSIWVDPDKMFELEDRSSL